MKQIYTLIIALSAFTIISCNKEMANTQTDVMTQLLANKNWYLDYIITEGATSTTPVVLKSFVGQTTYFVTYLKNGITNDSDGISGTYTVEIHENQSQIHLQLKTSNGNPFEVIYNIISVGESNLVLAKVIKGPSSKLYFTTK